MAKRVCWSVVLIVSVVCSSTFSKAAETRGLRIVAKDPGSGQQKEVRLYNKSYAVIIGIDQYQNLPFSEQLTYAVRDAKGVEEVLRKHYKFDKVIALYNKQATKDNILKVLMEDLPNEMTEEDALFVFWAGHGNQESTRTGDLGYLVPYDGDIAKLQSNITMTTVKEDISKKLPAKHVFYVMDACYSGLLTATRGLESETKRDFAYLDAITKEPVRQVLTAGGKNQKVLDGGIKGHSVFTGRLIEQLENADDFITANELQAKITEKVFSDARAMSATQTPSYGKLYGMGDFVFVPSLERRVEDTQAKIDALQAEMDKWKKMEEDAAKAKDDQQRREANVEKRQVEAKLAAERLHQQTFEEQRKQRDAEQREEDRRQAEAGRQKKENEERLARLSRDVEEKRKTLDRATFASLSPQKTLDEMQAIDRKIQQVRVQFRDELKNGILQVVSRMNPRYLKLADTRKDEFESEPEFQERINDERAALDKQQTDECALIQDRLENEYKTQIAPFIDELKRLSRQTFTITAENLTIELSAYEAATNTYPVSIKAKKPFEIPLDDAQNPVKQAQASASAAPAVVQEQPKMKYVIVAANADIPIPRDEAHEFKQHFENNMLRSELKGNFETPETFVVAQAHIIDDATTRQYDLFAAEFVDLGNGTVFDTRTKLLWSANAQFMKFKSSSPDRIEVAFQKDLQALIDSINIGGLKGWRLPTLPEIRQMVYLKNKRHPFINVYIEHEDRACMCGGYLIEDKRLTRGISGYSAYSLADEESGAICGHANGSGFRIWPVRGDLLKNSATPRSSRATHK